MWAFIMGLLLGVLIGFFTMGLCMAAGTVLSLINDAPDGIVRCQDCKYSDWWGPKGKEVLDCTRLDVPHVTPEWYCAWGERREDAKTN